ncbi:MAG: beta-lactamase family protein [Xanthomonadales bacterium]|nr:beta-lactamase family protein [Gammaproteobacteria bacterium]NNE05555.1 beta-lactamase family protein [Xanthomonadales bacterium]NNL95757.1 beta-lactamase family protein [Xanthomonadales bacterium]
MLIDRIRVWTICPCLLLAQSIMAQNVPFDSPRWTFQAQDHQQLEHLGRQALRLEGGMAWIEDLDIQDGEIAFDIAFGPERGFSGGIWRMRDRDNFEEFYLRPHQSGNPDANQYTPIFNGNPGWQLYHGEGYGSPVEYRFNEWMPVRIRFTGTRAEIFIDSDEPVVRVRELKHGPGAGKVGIMSSYAPAYFSNFRVAEGRFEFSAKTEPQPTSLDDHVRQWMVSDPFSWSRLDEKITLDSEDLAHRSWQLLTAEEKGITNLSRVARFRSGNDTVFARATFHSSEARKARLRFGYSDNIKLYANGKLIYEGSNSYGSRDYRYLGTIGLFDSVLIELEPGTNEIVMAVQELFGGWGVLAQWATGTPVQAVAGQTFRKNQSARIELAAAIEARVSQRAGEDGFSGSVLVSRGGATLLDQNYGVKDAMPVQLSPAYWIASNAKQFAGAAIALLESEGKIDIDAPINRYLESVPSDKRSITVRHLLTHSSGLGQNYAAEGIADREAAVRAILNTNLVANPGDEYHYSNDGFSLLAIIAERVAGQSYESWLRSRLLEPIGMTGTGLWGHEEKVTIAPLQNPESVEKQSDSIYSNGRSVHNWGYHGATGIYSTTQDLERWASVLIRASGNPQHPLANVVAPGRLIREDNTNRVIYYGYGIGVVMRDGQLEMVSHIGDDDWLGHNSVVAAYADGDIIVVLSNAGYLEDGTPWAAAITRDIRGILRDPGQHTSR